MGGSYLTDALLYLINTIFSIYHSICSAALPATDGSG